jgi:hypothetical protein
VDSSKPGGEPKFRRPGERVKKAEMNNTLSAQVYWFDRSSLKIQTKMTMLNFSLPKLGLELKTRRST